MPNVPSVDLCIGYDSLGEIKSICNIFLIKFLSILRNISIYTGPIYISNIKTFCGKILSLLFRVLKTHKISFVT